MQVWRVPLRKVNQSYVIATSTRLTSLSGAIVGDNLPGKMIIGCNNVIGHHVVVGIKCQDMKYKASNECFLKVGDNNEIMEHVIGDNNLIMRSCHIAHDYKVGSNNIFANNTLLAGHVLAELPIPSVSHGGTIKSIPAEDPYRRLQTVIGAAPMFLHMPAEDETPIEAYITEVASAPPPPPSFLPSLIRPLRTRAAIAQMRSVAPSTYYPLLLSGTPLLLPIPLLAPSTSRRDDIPEADTPPRKRLLLTAPIPGCEVGESSTAAAARQPGPTMARRVDCSSVNTVETRVRDTERRMMAALEVVNLRVSYQVDVRSKESSEFYSRHHDAQKDRAAMRAEIGASGRRRSPRTKAYHHKQALEAGARDDTLEDTGALTWWNSHGLTVSHDVAYAMTWALSEKEMTDKMFPDEPDKIERYIGGLPDMIHGNIVASKPKTMQEAVEMATELMDKKVITIAERQAENKRKFENTSRNNQNQQQQNKRQNTGRAYTAGTGEKKPYGGSKPLCAKCNYHHDGLCAPKSINQTKWPIALTVGVWEMPTMLTIRGALGQARNLLASSVEFKDTSRGNAQS
ncbi:putative reverse transcriptase domain-containing protein [Tanacetum coccineum]